MLRKVASFCLSKKRKQRMMEREGQHNFVATEQVRGMRCEGTSSMVSFSVDPKIYHAPTTKSPKGISQYIRTPQPSFRQSCSFFRHTRKVLLPRIFPPLATSLMTKVKVTGSEIGITLRCHFGIGQVLLEFYHPIATVNDENGYRERIPNIVILLSKVEHGDCAKTWVRR